MQQLNFIITCCVFLSACQITISGGKFNSDVCKGYGRLESKIDILAEKLDRSLDMLKKNNKQVKEDCKEDGRLESKVDILTAKLDRSIDMLKKSNKQVKDWKQNKCAIKNIALRKKSQQSSWHLKTHSWGNHVCCAEYAHDGNATTYSHTNYDNLPYWWVDLGNMYDIKWIEIINRSDYNPCQITISGGKFNSDVCKGYGELESKVDILTAKVDRSLQMLKTINELVKDNKPNNGVIKNVALKKRIQQSSWYAKTRSWGNYICCATEYANDGNATTFSHTNYENSPYLWVDLGHVYDIKRIEIINRSDDAGSRLHDVDITVGPTLNELSLCVHYKGPGKTKEHLVFHCNKQMRGRYVKVTIKSKEYLQLSEVMVFAPEISE